MAVSLFLGFIFLFFFLSSWFDIAFSSYFSQDDFFHLRLIMDKSFIDIPNFFTNFLEGQTFYRPISRETFNLLIYKLFGLDPLPFHFINLGLILLNITLTFFLIKNLSNNRIWTTLTTGIYAISAIHSIELYYLPSVQTLMATSFCMFSIIFYLFFFKLKNLNFFFASLLFFLMALLSHEMSIILPGILILLHLYLRGFVLKNLIKYFLPFFISSLIYLLSIQTLLSLPKQQVYQPNFSIKSIANTYFWYGVWSLNLPEILVDFTGPRLSLNTNFKLWYKNYYQMVSMALMTALIGIILVILNSKGKIYKDKLIYVLIACYSVSISPFLFFPQHKFVYYLSFPTIWFSATLGFILSKTWGKNIYSNSLVIMVVISLAIIAYDTNRLNQITYWAAKRAQAAEALLKNIKITYPQVEPDAIFYLLNDPNYPFIAKDWGGSSKQAFFILSGKDALQLLYNSNKIRVYFEDIEKPPLHIKPENIRIVTAKFPF